MPKFNRDNNAGLYLTISVHLIVLIIFLLYKIGSFVQKETSFVLDFTKQEQLEEEIRKMEFKESVKEEVDALIAQAKGDAVPRNVVVDRGSQLKDDRSKNPSQVYEDARKLQEKLDAAKKEAELMDLDENEVSIPQEEKNREEKAYTGPSVISYRLEGRKAMSLPIPAYKCMGGGDVTVAIIVNRKGYVVTAKVITEVSSNDGCLTDYAVSAAKRSRFTASNSAPERQAGQIVYRFVTQ